MAAGHCDPRTARSRAAIVAAAGELLREHGVAGVTMEGVAERAGVAKTTVYRAFPTRGELLVATFACLNPHPPQPAGDGLRDFLLGQAVALLDKLADPTWAPALTALMDEAERNTEVDRLAREHAAGRRAPLVERLRRAVESGEVAAGLDPELCASRFIGPFFYRRFFTRQPTTPQQAEQLVDAFLDGIRPTRSPAPRDAS